MKPTATIYRHPSAPAPDLKPYSDPREQDVCLTRAAAREREELENGTCVCGEMVRHHRTVSGVWIGCEGAKRRGAPQQNPVVYADPRPGLTEELRRTLVMDCGPRLEILMAGFSRDEQASIAYKLAVVAATYLRTTEGK